MEAGCLYGAFEELESLAPASYWSRRILEEIAYLAELSRIRGDSFNTQLERGLHIVKEGLACDGVITRQTVEAAEDALAELREPAKSLAVYCTANAHMDMNWMWGYQETAALTIDTIRTVLTLMNQYPDFVYTQSQASVYAIVEQYAPELLGEIRTRVHEGRWEASVSSWVENDKNMPSAESMARHLLYAKRYVSALLDIPAEQLDLDFEPDAFGHSCHLPEILQAGGVRYYYHCRGHEGENLCLWRAPSGAEVLAYREPSWYNLSIDYEMCRHVPDFCSRYNVDAILMPYGVGDHGGGPTRRDLERLADMAAWPLFPRIIHGTVRQYFQRIAPMSRQLPVVSHELNYVFTGCYTSQARIKRANRLGEDRLYEAEALDIMASIWGKKEYILPQPFEKAWRGILFNQFHDILPGSGTVETREFAMGTFQSAMALAETAATRAMRSVAEGAVLPLTGVGAFTGEGRSCGFSWAGEEGGQHFALFNTTAYDRREIAELLLWDCRIAGDRFRVMDAAGNSVPYQVLEMGTAYWGHTFCRLAILAKVPSFGYAIYRVESAEPKQMRLMKNSEPRADTYNDGNLVLENRLLRVEFRRSDMKCLSLVDKLTGLEQMDTSRPACGFEMVTEDPSYGMTSWRVGPLTNVMDINSSCSVYVKKQETGAGYPLRQTLSYTCSFLHSRLEVDIYLDKDSDHLRFETRVDWHETGTPDKGIPQLRFVLPHRCATERYTYLAPGGAINRKITDHDVPSLGLICADFAKEERGLSLLADCKYGFRGQAGLMTVTLLRGAYDPDPCPDQGIHHMTMAVAVGSAEPKELKKRSMLFSHKLLSCSTDPANGQMGASLLSVEGGSLEAVKRAEDGQGIILRVVNYEARRQTAVVTFGEEVVSASLTDLMEHQLESLPCMDGRIVWNMEPAKLYSLMITLKNNH